MTNSLAEFTHTIVSELKPALDTCSTFSDVEQVINNHKEYIVYMILSDMADSATNEHENYMQPSLWEFYVVSNGTRLCIQSRLNDYTCVLNYDPKFAAALLKHITEYYMVPITAEMIGIVGEFANEEKCNIHTLSHTHNTISNSLILTADIIATSVYITYKCGDNDELNSAQYLASYSIDKMPMQLAKIANKAVTALHVVNPTPSDMDITDAITKALAI